MQPNRQKKLHGRDAVICAAIALVGYLLLRVPLGAYDISFSVGACAMYLAAYLLPNQLALLCCVVPALLGDVVGGAYILLPMTLVVSTLCQHILCKLFERYVQNNLSRYLLPCAVYGLFFLVGRFFYIALGYGVLAGMVVLWVSLVEWIVCAVLGYGLIVFYRARLMPKLT